VRDYAEVKADGHITAAVADAALHMLDVDTARPRPDGPQAAVGDAGEVRRRPGRAGQPRRGHRRGTDTIEDVLEPYLIQQGYLQRTPRGRMATPGQRRRHWFRRAQGELRIPASPAHLDDLLTVGLEVEKLTRVRVIFRQHVRRGDDELVTGTVEIACVDMATMKPAPIPDFLYSKLEALK
jgi:hypothetical protein